MRKGRVVIFSAPSGAGKTTLVRHLLSNFQSLAFSVSATSRPKRGKEIEGKDYYFFNQDDFKEAISEGRFLEWEEVYPGCFYGTLRSEIESLFEQEKVVIFDVDVMGGLHLKSLFGHQALAVFIKPPSIQALLDRLVNRATDSQEKIVQRLEKASKELAYEDRFDVVILNENLETAKQEALEKVTEFLNEPIL